MKPRQKKGVQLTAFKPGLFMHGVQEGHIVDETRSCRGLLQPLTDLDALALRRGDVVLIETLRGVAPIVIDRVRMGVAYEDAEGLHPYEVPVIEGLAWGISDGWQLRQDGMGNRRVFAIPDLSKCIELAEEIPR